MKKSHVILLCLIIAAATVAITLTIVFVAYRPAEPKNTEDPITTEDKQTEKTTEAETTVIVSDVQIIPPDEITLPEMPENMTKEMLWRTVGSVVSFGTYEQDNNPNNGAEAIEWIIIDVDVENDTILLVSKLCLDYIPYYYVDMSEGYNQSKDVGASWLNSDLREWLNHMFYQSSFSEEEKEKMTRIELEYTLDDYDNVTILTKDEAEKMVENKLPIASNTTPYAVTHRGLLSSVQG